MVYDFSILDLIPYILLVSICIYISSSQFIIKFGNKNYKPNNAYLIYIILFVFSAIRYGIGYDYFAYRDFIELEAKDYVYERMEPLSLLFVNTAKSIKSTYLYFAFYSLIILYPIYYVSKHESRIPALSMLLFILYPSFFLDSMGIIRNAVAFSMIFMSYHFIKRKKILTGIIFIILSILNHNSGYIGLLILLFNFVHFSRKTYIIALIASFIIGDNMLNILSTVSSTNPIFNAAYNYLFLYPKEVGSMKYLILLIGIFVYMNWSRILKINPQNIILLNYVGIGVCLFFLFIKDDTLSFRLSNFFLLFLLLLVPEYINSHKVYAKKRVLTTFFFLSLFCFSFYINIVGYLDKKTERMNYLPYQTIFYHKNYANY